MCKIRFANTRYCSPLWAYLMTVIITTSVNQQFSAVQFRRASTYTFDGEKVDRKVVGNVYIETSATAIDHSSLLVCCLRRELVQSSASLSVFGRDRTFHPLDTCSPPIVAGIHTVAQKPDPLRTVLIIPTTVGQYQYLLYRKSSKSLRCLRL